MKPKRGGFRLQGGASDRIPVFSQFLDKIAMAAAKLEIPISLLIYTINEIPEGIPIPEVLTSSFPIGLVAMLYDQMGINQK